VDKTSSHQPLTPNAILLRDLSDEERLELYGLLEEHPFPGETATIELKREVAIALETKLDKRNFAYDEYQLTKQLVDRLCGAKDVKRCVEWVSTKKLKKMIQISGVGDPFINEGVRYGETSSQRVINLFVTQLGGFKGDSEGAVEKTSGCYLKGFVTGKGLVTKQSVHLSSHALADDRPVIHLYAFPLIYGCLALIPPPISTPESQRCQVGIPHSFPCYSQANASGILVTQRTQKRSWLVRFMPPL
jgi:hypothetical protein